MQKNLIGLNDKVYSSLEEQFLAGYVIAKKIGLGASTPSAIWLKKKTLGETTALALRMFILDGLFNGIRYTFPNEIEEIFIDSGVYTGIKTGYCDILNKTLKNKAIKLLEARIEQLRRNIKDLEDLDNDERIEDED